jgi:hypothetical protein
MASLVQLISLYDFQSLVLNTVGTLKSQIIYWVAFLNCQGGGLSGHFFHLFIFDGTRG